MVKGEDGQMVECEIISTKDKESVFDKNAPVLPLFLAIICCILNIVPGKKIFFLVLQTFFVLFWAVPTTMKGPGKVFKHTCFWLASFFKKLLSPEVPELDCLLEKMRVLNSLSSSLEYRLHSVK